MYFSSINGWSEGASVFALAHYLYAVRRTARLDWTSIQPVTAQVADGLSVIVAIWHEEALLHLVLGLPLPVAVVVTATPAGNVYSHVLRRLGFAALRGSELQQLRAARRFLAGTGHVVVIAVDGPAGPKRVAKGGVAALARCSGAPVVPLHCKARRGRTGKTWDSRIWPLPFDELEFRASDPIHVPKITDKRGLATSTLLVQSKLNELYEASQGPERT